MPPRIQEVTIDCEDAARLAEFWGRLLERPWGHRPDLGGVVDAGAMFLYFQVVPEPKSSPKNRLHLDVAVDDIESALTRAVSLGAVQVGQVQRPDDDGGFVVCQDPEGNELCLVTEPAGTWTRLLRSVATEGIAS